MNPTIARLSALALVGLVAVSVVALVVTSRPLKGGREVRAEFADAWPLVEGMDVRVSGAVAGQVKDISLSDRGTAEVTLVVHDGLPAPHADASVAVRQQDLLGDSYLSLSLGHARAPLRGPIPPARAIQAPRLDDLLDTFEEPVRDGMKAFLVELGMALEHRGDDINATILRLRPGFRGTGELLTELRGQNRALAHVLGNSHHVTQQLAAHSKDLDRLIGGVAATVSTLARHDRALDSGFRRLPAQLVATRRTLRRVRGLSDALPGLARAIAEGAPDFTRASRLLGPFAEHARRAAKDAVPTLQLTGHGLRTGAPALANLRERGRDLLTIGSLVFGPLKPIATTLADGLLGNDDGGGLGGPTMPGNDVVDPRTDPARSYLAGVLVLSCELLGAKVEPGCLANAAGTLPLPTGTPPPSKRKTDTPTPAVAPPPPPAAPLPKLVDKVADTGQRAGEAVKNLLDFLLKP